jgi:HipA-like protein
MTALVIAEHDNASVKGATLNTVTAAAQCGGEVHVLIAGHNAGPAAAAAAQIAGVSKVIHADAEYLVGTWHAHRGTHSFTYTPTWPASEKSRPLSLSLPLTRTLEIKGDVVANYFDNLLPDNDRIRERIGRRFKTKTLDAFALLEAIGRDCVGAVQLLPEGTTPDGWDRVECEPLTEAEVADALHAVPADPRTRPGNEAPAFRISLAGAQEKTAFTLVNGQWCRPLGATPSTHIFKLPLGVIANTSRVEMFNSVENEWVCAQIIEALGLPMARTEMASFGDQRALIVERFDREWMDDGQWIARLPQEDFCQALGQPPRMKYEEDGGPPWPRDSSCCLEALTPPRTGSCSCSRSWFSGSWLRLTGTPRISRSSCVRAIPTT